MLSEFNIVESIIGSDIFLFSAQPNNRAKSSNNYVLEHCDGHPRTHYCRYTQLVLAMDAAAAEEERQQQALMRSLRAFVDALRDIKRDAPPAADAQRAVRALCLAPDARWSEQQCRENVWRTGLVPMLQRLCLCMERLDRIEVPRI